MIRYGSRNPAGLQNGVDPQIATVVAALQRLSPAVQHAVATALDEDWQLSETGNPQHTGHVGIRVSKLLVGQKTGIELGQAGEIIRQVRSLGHEKMGALCRNNSDIIAMRRWKPSAGAGKEHLAEFGALQGIRPPGIGY